MIVFTSIDIVDDNYLILWAPCDCRGNPECDCVNGEQIVGEVDLTTLLRNIAVAAGLTRSFRLGDAFAWDMAWNDHTRQDQITDRWRPNIDGRPAP